MSSIPKIYTKTGDKGETSLIGGTRLPKYHSRIEAYGTVDELNSYIGLIRDQEIDKLTKEILIKIQEQLLTIGSVLATDTEKKQIKEPLRIFEEDINLLEKNIDEINRLLPVQKSFILPGGNTVISFCHIARCVCRRAERITVKLAESFPVDELIIKYLNRLSDFLFVLARKFAKDFNVEEISWKPKI